MSDLGLALPHFEFLSMYLHIQRVPALCAFWDLEKTVLHEIRVSGTVLWSPTNANPPLTRTKAKKRVSGNRVSHFRVSGGPPVFPNHNRIFSKIANFF